MNILKNRLLAKRLKPTPAAEPDGESAALKGLLSAKALLFVFLPGNCGKPVDFNLCKNLAESMR